jgi:hypothetical protein
LRNPQLGKGIPLRALVRTARGIAGAMPCCDICDGVKAALV